MKRALKIIGIVGLVIFLSVIGAAIYFVHQLGKPFDEARRFLLHDVDYHAVSVACLDVMTKPEFRPLIGEYPSGDDSRLPAAIRDVKAFWLAVSTSLTQRWRQPLETPVDLRISSLVYLIFRYGVPQLLVVRRHAHFIYRLASRCVRYLFLDFRDAICGIRGDYVLL